MALHDPIERRVTRCAIYTRKSTEQGLDRAVSSLETQRDVCSAYIKCQAHRNWLELPHGYDDGGYSGGTLVRPALSRLIGDIEAGRIDMVVIYKIDRLTRSALHTPPDGASYQGRPGGAPRLGGRRHVLNALIGDR